MLCSFRNITVVRHIFLKNVLQTFRMVYSLNIRLYVIRNSSTSVTALDDFTAHLVNEKTQKWIRTARQQSITVDPINIQNENSNSLQVNLDTEVDIENLNPTHIDNLLLKALDLKNYVVLNSVLDHCIKYKRLPTMNTFLEVISSCSQMSLLQEVMKLHDLICENDPYEYEVNAKLKHFEAEVLWKQGNIDEAVKHFIDLYAAFPNLRTKILQMCLHMIFELVSKGNNANLVMMTKFAKTFSNNYKEIQPLCLIWELTFLSTWFSDQIWSKEILEQNPEILDKIKLRFLPIAVYSLQKHDVDTTQRILEVMLAHQLKQPYVALLHILFDYKCAQRDLRGCTEIMNTAIAQGIPMQTSHQVKFLHLLLGKKIPETTPVKKILVPRYTLKF